MNDPQAPVPSRERQERGAPYEAAPVVLALTVANVLVFVAVVALDRDWSAIMMPRHETMMALGANYAPATLREGRIETLITSCFLHFGILHLGFNMVALRQVGPFLERAVGSGRLALLYVVTGIAGAASSALWTRVSYFLAENATSLDMEVRQALASRLHSVSAGASGAICGLIGAVLVIGIRAQGVRGDLARAMARWLGMIVLIGFLLPADNAAHIGGAASGALIAASWKRRPESASGRTARIGISAVVILAAALRVTAVSASDPFASLTADGRLKLAEKLHEAGKCREADEARARALRISPEAKGSVRFMAHPCP